MPYELLYVIGEPGAGKTTFTAALTHNCMNYVVRRPFGYTVWQGYGGEVIELGVARAQFSGTDALSMSVQPVVLKYLETMRPPLVLAEGDRLATSSFFHDVGGIGYNLTVVNLLVPPAIAQERRVDRAAQLGRAVQKDTWVQGRKTKLANLRTEFSAQLFDVDATSDVSCMVEAVREHPVAAALLGKEKLC